MNDFLLKIGDTLKDLRIARGWTQLELSLRAGVSNTTVHKMEYGGVTSLHILYEIANALGVTLEFNIRGL